MIGTFTMRGSTVRCSLELYFQIPHYPLTQIHHPENRHARSSQARSKGFETPQDNQDHPFWLVACWADASRFPSGGVYFNMPCTVSSPSSRHSGGYFPTVKLILKYLLLDFDFLHNGSKVLHAGESNRMPEWTQAFYSSKLPIAVPIKTCLQISRRAIRDE